MQVSNTSKADKGIRVATKLLKRKLRAPSSVDSEVYASGFAEPCDASLLIERVNFKLPNLQCTSAHISFYKVNQELSVFELDLLCSDLTLNSREGYNYFSKLCDPIELPYTISGGIDVYSSFDNSNCSEVQNVSFYTQSESDYLIYREYNLPWRERHRIVITIRHINGVNSIGNGYILDQIFRQFYFMSLRKIEVIDSPTLSSWLRLMNQLTPSQLHVLQDIVSSSRHDLSTTARRIGISKRSVQNHIYNAMRSIEPHMPESFETKGYRALTLDMFNTFYFMKFSKPTAGNETRCRYEFT